MSLVADGKHLLLIRENLIDQARTVQIVTKPLFSVLDAATVVKGINMWTMVFGARVVETNRISRS